MFLLYTLRNSVATYFSIISFDFTPVVSHRRIHHNRLHFCGFLRKNILHALHHSLRKHEAGIRLTIDQHLRSLTASGNTAVSVFCGVFHISRYRKATVKSHTILLTSNPGPADVSVICWHDSSLYHYACIRRPLGINRAIHHSRFLAIIPFITPIGNGSISAKTQVHKKKQLWANR